MPVLTILLSDLEPHEIASGSGVATFFRTLGGSFAASLTTWAWNQRTVIHHAQLTEHIPAADPVIRQTVEALGQATPGGRSEEHTSELQSLMRHSYAVFCLKKKHYTSK